MIQHLRIEGKIDRQSRFLLADTPDERSICFSDLYILNGEISFLTVGGEIPPSVNKWTNTYPWKPKVLNFESHEQLEAYLAHFGTLGEIPLAVYGDILWVSNIGHALFDGLYPLFLSLVKFDKHNEDFTLIVNHWENHREMSTQVMEDFSGNKILELDATQGRNFHIKLLMTGTGRTGNRVIREDYTLYGTKWKAMELFKFRMLQKYGIESDLPLNRVPKIFIIDNKRYSPYEKGILLEIVDYYRERGHDIQYIAWQDHRPLKNQLEMLRDVDIHISGPGTSANNMSFLKKGAVNINLGWMERTQTNTMRPNLIIPNASKSDYFVPAYMEQCVMAGSDYVNTIYYDRYKHNDIDFVSLLLVIEEAISIVQNHKTVQNKHFLDAMIFREYCERNANARKLCDHLTGIAFFIEFFINEHPTAIDPRYVDIDLLRDIKEKFGFDRRYEIKV